MSINVSKFIPLKSKYCIPYLPPTVDRERFIRIFDEIRGRKITTVIAGAGFEKDNFRKFLSQGIEYEDITKNTRIENIGSHGRSGIGEVIKRGGVEKTAEELSAARDIKLVEKLMEHIGKDTLLF